VRISQVGLIGSQPGRSYPGYTLLAPLRARSCYLLGMRGEVVHEWRLPDRLGSLACMLPGGRLLTTGMTAEGPPIIEGKGGHFREYDWNGNLLWEYVDHGQHHDFRRLANGNTLYLGWERMPVEAARRVRGGVPGSEAAKGGQIYSDYLREVNPAGQVVWQWHAFDLDIEARPLADDCWRWEYAHANSCCPLADGRVLLSFRHLDTLMMIDRAGRVVWERRDPLWGHQHNAEMLPDGNITLFANGMTNLIQPLCSRVVELDPASGETVWQYRAAQSWTFFSPIISGAQRLPNGGTLICEGMSGRIFEVTRDGEIVWEYVSPYFTQVFPNDGPCNCVFRAYRYAADSEEISGRLPPPC